MSSSGRPGVAVGVVVAAVSVLAAVVAVVGIGHRPEPLDRRVQDVATTLRCPSCNGETVAASNAPIAQSMRSEIRSQLRDGRSPAQIRTWFEGRYGADVVTLPSSRGPEAALWLLPGLVLCAGAAGLVVGLRRRRGLTQARRSRRADAAAAAALPGRRVAVAAGACLAVGVLVPVVVWARSPDAGGGSTAAAAAGQASQGGQGSPSQGAQQPLTAAGWAQVAATLESQQDYAGAARAYRKALHLDPGSTEARTRLGFDLLRAGRPSAAVPVVRPLTAKKGAARPMALLVLGLAQRSEHDPAAARTLRTFLRVAPNHPAAAQVRRLLHTPG